MRRIVKSILSRSRVLKPLKYFHQNKLIIFNYHRIRDNSKPMLFNENLFGPDAERFRKEMEWIKKETRILSEDELIESIYSKKPFNELCSLVTLDDGYRDNFDIAYPILSKLKIPAIFFIPTQHLTERNVGWWDLVAFFIKNTSQKHFYFQKTLYELTHPKNLINLFVSDLKHMEPEKINDYLHQLSLAVDVPFPAKELQCQELMTCEQIKILSDKGMSIGSHSHDHSILSRQNNHTLKKQIGQSIEILESVVQKKIKTIAYPVGGYDHFTSDTKEVVKDLGLKLGFSYLTGINQWGKVDPFDVKRMRLNPEWLNLDMPLAFPHFFLKNQFASKSKAFNNH